MICLWQAVVPVDRRKHPLLKYLSKAYQCFNFARSEMRWTFLLPWTCDKSALLQSLWHDCWLMITNWSGHVSLPEDLIKKKVEIESDFMSYIITGNKTWIWVWPRRHTSFFTTVDIFSSPWKKSNLLTSVRTTLIIFLARYGVRSLFLRVKGETVMLSINFNAIT